MPKQRAPIFIGKRAADRCSLLDKVIPDFVVVRDDLERWRQTQVMAVSFEQSYAEAVDRTEKGAIERSQYLERNACLQHLGACALLHLVRCAISERDDHELKQPVARIFAFCDMDNAIGNRPRFARARGCDNGKIPVQLGKEAFAVRLIDRLVHDQSSSSSAKARWVSTHFPSRNSLSIGSVARG